MVSNVETLSWAVCNLLAPPSNWWLMSLMVAYCHRWYLHSLQVSFFLAGLSGRNRSSASSVRSNTSSSSHSPGSSTCCSTTVMFLTVPCFRLYYCCHHWAVSAPPPMTLYLLDMLCWLLLLPLLFPLRMGLFQTNVVWHLGVTTQVPKEWDISA